MATEFKEHYSDKELEFRNKGLQEIKSVLNEINIECILIFGILLGAVRDKNYIKWDWDVEVSVFSEEFVYSEEVVVIFIL